MDHGQDLLSEQLQRFLRERYTDPVRRKILRSSQGWSAEIWDEFVKLGLVCAFASEENGGLGAGSAELMSIMEAFGRNLVIEPFVSTAVIGATMFSELKDTDAVGAIASGKMRVALAHDERPFGLDLSNIATDAGRAEGGYRLTGRKIIVRDAPSVTHLIVSARMDGRGAFSLFLVPLTAERLRLDCYRLIDGAPAADIRLEDVIVPKSSLLLSGDAVLALLPRLLGRATVAACAEANGVMRAMLEQTVAYMGQRHQFGRPLSSFQALQHRVADMLIEIEQALSLTYRASLASQDLSAISAAKIRVNEALRAVAHGAVQIHGGIGTTDEIALSQYFRRATAIQQQYGSSSDHYRRLEQGLSSGRDRSASARHAFSLSSAAQ